MTPITSNNMHMPLPEQVVNGTYAACKKTYDASKSLAKLAAPYLTFSFLTQKTNNAIRAQAHPLSVPAALIKEEEKTKHQAALFKSLKSNIENDLNEKESKITQLENMKTAAPHAFYGSHHENDLLNLQTESTTKKKQLQTVIRNLDTAQIKLSHLNTLQSTQITGQLACWTGRACNLITPGYGIVVSLAMVTWATAMREQDAQKICDIALDKTFAEQTRRKIRIGTWITAATAVASPIIWMLAKPLVVDAIQTVYSVATQQFNSTVPG